MSMTPQVTRLAQILHKNFYTRKGDNANGALKHKYGLNLDDVCALMIAQDGYCECCGADFAGNVRWCVDHNHVTGKARGLLCYACNTGIGKLGGTIEGLRKGIDYLTKHGES